MTARPRLEIEYCTSCRWFLRAAWTAQELLTTFEAELGEVALQPGAGGVFEIRVDGETIWSRQVDGGFPGLPELKRIVRDRVPCSAPWAFFALRSPMARRVGALPLRVNPSRLTRAYEGARQRTNRLRRAGNRLDAPRRAYAVVAKLKDPRRTRPAGHDTHRAADVERTVASDVRFGVYLCPARDAAAGALTTHHPRLREERTASKACSPRTPPLRGQSERAISIRRHARVSSTAGATRPNHELPALGRKRARRSAFRARRGRRPRRPDARPVTKARLGGNARVAANCKIQSLWAPFS